MGLGVRLSLSTYAQQLDLTDVSVADEDTNSKRTNNAYGTIHYWLVLQPFSHLK